MSFEFHRNHYRSPYEAWKEGDEEGIGKIRIAECITIYGWTTAQNRFSERLAIGRKVDRARPTKGLSQHLSP